jgi:hypothetical protein
MRTGINEMETKKNNTKNLWNSFFEKIRLTYQSNQSKEEKRPILTKLDFRKGISQEIPMKFRE